MDPRRRWAYWRLRRRARRHETFHDKILRKIAFDRDPILTTMCDRIAVRDLVAETIGDEYLTQAHAVADDPDDIPWDRLPLEYVVKASHGSGAMVLVRDDAEDSARLPATPKRVGWERLSVRPEHADPDRLIPLLRHWLTLDYSWFPGKRTPEWGYEGVPPRLLVEELLREPDGGLPVEYHGFVVHGRVTMVHLTYNRFPGRRPPGTPAPRQTHAYFDREWNRVPLQFFGHGRALGLASDIPPLPEERGRIIEIAEALGALTDGVRVDLYCIGGRILFSELTPYQNAGVGGWEPRWFDLQMAAGWHQDY